MQIRQNDRELSYDDLLVYNDAMGRAWDFIKERYSMGLCTVELAKMSRDMWYESKLLPSEAKLAEEAGEEVFFVDLLSSKDWKGEMRCVAWLDKENPL